MDCTSDRQHDDELALSLACNAYTSHLINNGNHADEKRAALKAAIDRYNESVNKHGAPKVDIGASYQCNGMGERAPNGDYVKLAVSTGDCMIISLGTAECLAAELNGIASNVHRLESEEY